MTVEPLTANNVIDLTLPHYAYMFGLLQTDGHMQCSTRNRGRVTLELGVRDVDIIKKLHKIIPFKSTIRYRTRDTNFMNSCTTAALTCHAIEFRNQLLKFGLPYGPKSDIITIPNVAFSVPDYWRGVIDGNGSLGITKQGRPYISLTCPSESLAQAYLTLIFTITGSKRKVNRNKRDNVYNIMIMNQDAITLVNYLYYDDCFSMDRKFNIATLIRMME